MIKVIKEKSVPRAKITCSNCGSILEYGNADLRRDYRAVNNMFAAVAGQYEPMCITCPVCGCDINAGWILKSEIGNRDEE